MPVPNPVGPHPWSIHPRQRLYIAILISLLLHAWVILGITFKVAQPTFNKVAKSLEVILVNSQSEHKPNDATILAEANLEGGGNVDDDRRAKSPVPVRPQAKPLVDLARATQKTKQMENEAKKLVTAVESKPRVVQADAQPTQSKSQPAPPLSGQDLLQRSLEIARLKAQINKKYEDHQKRPKRKFVGARTKEYRFARYVEDWRLKVERIGNLNYPEAARRQNLYGSLQLTVGIWADGSLESISIDRSSGAKILDDAAINIVKLAAQNGFAPFPPDISRDTDILHITRTWVFARSDKLLSE